MTKMIPVAVRVNQIEAIGGMRVVGWPNGYAGSHSIVTLECAKDGYVWNPVIRDVCDRGKRCPKCAGVARVRVNDMLERLSQIDGIEFVGWLGGEYKNSKTKAVVRCDIDGTEWSSIVLDLQNGHGCPKCALARRSRKRANPIDVAEKRLLDAGIPFSRWVSGTYENNRSKLVAVCERHGEWTTSFGCAMSGCGCPSCSATGLSRNKASYLYALVSDDGGMIKIGVTNNVKSRIRSLKKSTPFGFEVVGIVPFSDGYKAEEKERSLHKLMNGANQSGFNGCTEWFFFDDLASSVLAQVRDMSGA